ncbi:MAG: hypothetical protein AAF990_09955 [Bacteroidota bacterium]
MKKGLWSVIGFTLFLTGMLAICLSVVGVQLSFLTWIDAPGRLFGFVIRLLMVMGGVIIVVLSRSNWQEEEAEI